MLLYIIVEVLAMTEKALYQIKKSVYDYLISLANTYNKTVDNRFKAAYEILASEYNILNSIDSVSDFNAFVRKIEANISKLNSRIDKLKSDYQFIIVTNPSVVNLKRISKEIIALRNQLKYYQIFLSKINIKEQSKENSFPSLGQSEVQKKEVGEIKSTKFTPVKDRENSRQSINNARVSDFRNDLKLSIAIAREQSRLMLNPSLTDNERIEIRKKITSLCEERRNRFKKADFASIVKLEVLEREYATILVNSVKPVELDKKKYISKLKKHLIDLGDLKIKNIKSSKYAKDKSKNNDANQREVDRQILKNKFELETMINCLFGKDVTLIDGRDNNKYTTDDLISYVSTFGFDMSFKEYKEHNAKVKVGNSKLEEIEYNQKSNLISEMFEKLANMASSKIDSLGGKIMVKSSNEEKEKEIFNTLSDIYKTIDKNMLQGEQFVR